ncbi:hypothetical protein B0H14DRAFT_3491900 [Mycena olivaceomarginata]|nr:hypothetical protein B0H14DRAFT_3491900 [Mycena olivaceomarginata]
MSVAVWDPQSTDLTSSRGATRSFSPFLFLLISPAAPHLPRLCAVAAYDPPQLPLVLPKEWSSIIDPNNPSKVLRSEELLVTGTDVLSFGIFALLTGFETLRGKPSGFIQVARRAVTSAEVLRAIVGKMYKSPEFLGCHAGEAELGLTIYAGHLWGALNTRIDAMVATDANNGYIPKVTTVETMAERERKRNHSARVFLATLKALQVSESDGEKESNSFQETLQRQIVVSTPAVRTLVHLLFERRLNVEPDLTALDLLHPAIPARYQSTPERVFDPDAHRFAIWAMLEWAEQDGAL